MLRLRPFKPCDAKTIVGWCSTERAFRQWSSDRYDKYPITAEDINRKYIDFNGDCEDEDNFYPMTAFDESGIVGHLILRFTDKSKTTVRLGFVIVDSSKRGKGFGKEMIKLALKYSFEILGASKATIGVFENNPSAYYCYKSAGFKEISTDNPEYYEILGEKWKCIELETVR